MVVRPDRDEAAEELPSKAAPWLLMMMDLELAFTPAQITISEPRVFDAVKAVYADTREVADSSNKELQRINLGIPANVEKLKRIYSRIIAQRRTTTAIVRTHLTEAPDLPPVYESLLDA